MCVTKRKNSETVTEDVVSVRIEEFRKGKEMLNRNESADANR